MGEFDTEVEFAIRFHWTPDEIGRLDPDYVDELIARMNAEARHAKQDAKKGRRKR